MDFLSSDAEPVSEECLAPFCWHVQSKVLAGSVGYPHPSKSRNGVKGGRQRADGSQHRISLWNKLRTKVGSAAEVNIIVKISVGRALFLQLGFPITYKPNALYKTKDPKL